MQSRLKILGHAPHPMLIVFPLGLLATAVAFDLINLFGGSDIWLQTSYRMIAAGVITGVIAAVFGWIDWFAIPAGTRAKSIGLTHGLGNAVVLVLFAASWLVRRGDVTDPSAVAFVLSFAGAGLAVFTGWLGGELVERLRVGVDDEADLDASNSLRHGDDVNRGRLGGPPLTR
jgi:uncharacterized membrane protein